MKITDPDRAKECEEFLLKRNDIDDILLADYDLSEVKYYPGSDKGPLPEDDPEGYSKWFVENQPKKLFADLPRTDFKEFGAKRKYVFMTRDNFDNHEYLT